jgi:protein involved in temperature-dependent protein secretion
MPITNVRRLNFTAPSTALDTLWRPAKIEDIDGNAADVHLPILYHPSYAAEQDAFRLGRMTDWQERGELYTGLGQHCYMAIREGEPVEYSLLDFENLEIETAS